MDASDAMNVALIIKALAQESKLTCVAVIHQPRGEIFDLIDFIIVLAPGGFMAYSGPTSLVLQWFASHGFILPHPKANRTDFIMDVTTGNFQFSKDDGKVISSADFDWSALWKQGGANFMAAFDVSQISSTSVLSLPNDAACDNDKHAITRSSTVGIGQPRHGFTMQFLFYLIQAFTLRIKYDTLVQDVFSFLVGGTVLGIVTSGGPLLALPVAPSYLMSCPPGSEVVCSRWRSFGIGPATFLITMVLGAMVIPPAVRTFGREKDTFAREEAVGAHKVAYFCGKAVIDMVFLSYYVFLFLTPMLAIAPWRGPVSSFYVILLSLSFLVTSVGYALSFVIADPDNAVLTGTIMAILFNLFGGFVPKLGDGLIGTLMYTHYSARAITAVELQKGFNIEDIEMFNQLVGGDPWKYPNWQQDVGNLLIISCVTNIVSYLLFVKQFIKFNSATSSAYAFVKSFSV